MHTYTWLTASVEWTVLGTTDGNIKVDYSILGVFSAQNIGRITGNLDFLHILSELCTERDRPTYA